MKYKDWWPNRSLGRAKVRMAHTFTNILIHAVFSTSGRSSLLSDAIRPDVHAYLGGILRELHAVPIAIGGTADHVHLLTRLPADLAVADCMRIVKTNSSRWMKERWPELRAFAWQRGYGAFAASESRRLAVVRYIENQTEHHRRISFQEEFLKLLKSHGVDFDARYIWQ
jgi:putative transposase